MAVTSQSSKIFTAGADYTTALQVTSLAGASLVIIPITGTGTARVKVSKLSTTGDAPTSNDDGEPIVGGGCPGVFQRKFDGGIVSAFIWVDAASVGATLTGVVQVENSGK